MLLVAAVVLCFAVLGLAAVAAVAHRAMRWLGLEPMDVLLFFGLAETPADDLSRRRRAPAGSRPREVPLRLHPH